MSRTYITNYDEIVQSRDANESLQAILDELNTGSGSENIKNYIENWTENTREYTYIYIFENIPSTSNSNEYNRKRRSDNHITNYFPEELNNDRDTDTERNGGTNDQTENRGN